MQNLFNKDEQEFLMTTKALMIEFGFRIRDTYNEIINLDDFYSNLNQYNGPRLFQVEYINDSKSKFAQTRANKAYSITGYSSLAYDKYKIMVPCRFREQNREDPIIHECVHFLQHTTPETESTYIDYNGCNYHEYVTQDCEIEAHLVQVWFILKYGHSANIKPKKDQTAKVEQQIDKYRETKEKKYACSAILLSKDQGLI